MPWPAFVLSLLALTLLGVFLRGARRLARWVLVLGLGGLMALSVGPLTFALWGEQERQYPLLDLTRPDTQAHLQRIAWVVVLGGGVVSAEPGAAAHQSALSRLQPTSLARLVEGVRLLGQMPTARLLLTGSGVFIEDSNAGLYQRAAMELGVDPERLVLLDQPADTESEVQALRGRLGDESFVLVTSANHLPRVMYLMAREGLTPLPSPAAYALAPPSEVWLRWLPSEANLLVVRHFWHETLGLWWLKLRDGLGGAAFPVSSETEPSASQPH